MIGTPGGSYTFEILFNAIFLGVNPKTKPWETPYVRSPHCVNLLKSTVPLSRKMPPTKKEYAWQCWSGPQALNVAFSQFWWITDQPPTLTKLMKFWVTVYCVRQFFRSELYSTTSGYVMKVDDMSVAWLHHSSFLCNWDRGNNLRKVKLIVSF